MYGNSFVVLQLAAKGVSASRVWRELSKMAELDMMAAVAAAAGGRVAGSGGGGGGGSPRLAEALVKVVQWGALQALFPGVEQVRVCFAFGGHQVRVFSRGQRNP